MQFKSLRRRQPAPTAIISDLTMVPDVLIGVADAGLRVPRDVSVISMEDSRWALAHDPKLTAVRSDSAAIGRQAGEWLLRSIGGDDVPDTPVPSPVELVIRESCARVRDDCLPNH